MDRIRELVKKAQQNDLGAFEQLVQIYQDRIFGVCLQLTRNHADAQDLAQEAFIRAYTHLSTFRFEADFGTWLHRIAINQGINFQRKQQREQALSLDAPVPTEEGELTRELAATGDDPEEFFAQRELQRAVHRALDKLSPEHRAVLVLRELQGHSYEEIAALMDCSLGTVKSRLSRARMALRDFLK